MSIDPLEPYRRYLVEQQVREVREKQEAEQEGKKRKAKQDAEERLNPDAALKVAWEQLGRMSFTMVEIERELLPVRGTGMLLGHIVRGYP